MAIVIYTYSNPYRLHREPYWAAIKNGFHLTVSQTLVNGLCDQYKNDFFEGKLTTITRFIIGEDNLSPVSIKRDFLSIPAESNMVDHQFQYLYSDVSRKWEENYGCLVNNHIVLACEKT